MFQYKLPVFGVIVCMLIAVVISLINPLIIETAIDTYIAEKDIPGLMHLAVFALAIHIVFILMVKIRMYVMAKISNQILLHIRQ